MSRGDRDRPIALTVVDNSSVSTDISVDELHKGAWPSSLFPATETCLFAVVNYSAIDGEDLLDILVNVAPRTIFDLRRSPRFDKRGISRSIVFRKFREINSKYFDVSGRLDSAGKGQEIGNPDIVGEFISRLLDKSARRGLGALMVLLDADQYRESFLHSLLVYLRPPSSDQWKIRSFSEGALPEASRSISPQLVDKSVDRVAFSRGREVVFISHANPEDNDFVLWLAAKLSVAGYDVWVDLMELRGGDVFWEKIEDAIREKASRVIFVQSHASLMKPNVLNEVDLALNVERQLGGSGFVIPVKIDDSKFDRTYIGLRRRHIIDFQRNWALGLAQLIEKFEDDGVPKRQGDIGSWFNDWCTSYLSANYKIAKTPENLKTNWLLCKSFPEMINFFEVEGVERKEISRLIQDMKIPAFQFERLIGSLAIGPNLKLELPSGIRIKDRCSFPLSEFLGGVRSELHIRRGDAIRNVTNLCRQAWEGEMNRRGLASYQMASGKPCWYFQKDQLVRNNGVFLDDEGKERKRKLVGRSERYGCYWHFGISASPVLRDVPRFILRPHVIFSKDGKNPLQSASVMHRLRRSFCKSWWNDRWRDLLLAFVASLREESDDFLIDVGASSSLVVDGELMVLSCPVSSLDSGIAASFDKDDDDWFEALSHPGSEEFETVDWKDTLEEVENSDAK